MMKLPIYPHLGMTEEQLATICEQLFEADPVIATRFADIKGQEAKKLLYVERIEAQTGDLQKLESQLDELNASLRANSTQTREVHGLIAGNKYHLKMADVRIHQARVAIDRRKRQLYLDEARRRLGALGKELKLGIGGARAGRGLGTEIRDIKQPK